MRSIKWQILNVRAFQIENYSEAARHWAASMRRTYPGAQVRSFKRTVRAGGASVELLVVVTRRAPTTCGKAIYVDGTYRRGQECGLPFKHEGECRLGVADAARQILGVSS